jgi:CDP-diacylglycerol--serine O-phosphatidyltransferase
MAGAYRLARFNLDKEQSAYFKGVPIPMIGMVTASFPLIYWQAQTSLFTQLMFSPFFWYAYIVLVSSLMVIKTPMLALKNIGKNKKLLLPLLLLVLEVMLTGVFFKWMAIPFGFIGYCLVSLIYRKTITQQ